MAVVEIELADLWDRVIEHVSLGEPQHRAFLNND
jgi:chromosomal replication initiator protein